MADTSSISTVVASGQEIYPPLVLLLKDEFNNTVSIDSSSILTVQAVTESMDAGIKEGFGNKTSFTAYNGYYILYPFSILKKPGNQASIRLESGAIKKLNDRTEITYA